MEYNSGLSACDKYQSRVLAIDLYRRPFNFLLPDHQNSYRTFLGSALSIIQFLLLVSYGTYQIILYSSQASFNVN